MSSPGSVGGNNASVGIRDGTRVILREITANLQNSSPGTSPRRKTGNEASPNKSDQQQQPLQQHDVKVRFIREFADATGTTVREVIPETSSLSSASSFQSLASTLSSKCSSGICVDSSPSKNADTSYISADISGLDDLISACENIRLDDTNKEKSFDLPVDSEENSNDETFTSAIDRASLERSRDNSPINFTREANDNINVNAALTRDLSTINIAKQSDFNLNVTTEIIRENLPINLPIEIADANLNVTEEILRENLFVNQGNSELNVTTEITTETLSINRQNQGNFDLNVTTEIQNENFVVTCENPDLNVTTEIKSDNLLINCPNKVNLDLDVTREIKAEDLPIDHPDQANPDLNVTTDITRENLPINRSYQENPDLNVTKDITSENLPINHSHQENPDLNVTKDITRENLPINHSNQENPDLNVTKDITRENLSINPSNQENPDLIVTKEITSENLPINPSNQENPDLNVTKDITRENLSINPSNQENPDLNVTKDITREDFAINRSDQPINDLDTTREVSNESLSINRTSQIDLDTTREVTNKNWPINRENLKNDTASQLSVQFNPLKSESNVQEFVSIGTFDGETKASLENSNILSKTVNLIAANPTFSELEQTNETFVQCVSDIGQLTGLNESAKALKNIELAKTDASPGNSKFTNNKEDEKLTTYEEYPLESITPSFTQFRENICPIEINEKINNKTVLISPTKNLTNFNVDVELQASKQLDNFVDTSKSFINEFTKDSKFPSLPTLSNIAFPSDINESINLLLPEDSIKSFDNHVKDLPSPKINENKQEIPSATSPSISAKFATIAENLSANSLTTIQEPTFIKNQNITNEICDVETRNLEISPKCADNNHEKIANCRTLEIDKAIALKSNNEELRIEDRQVEKSNLSRKLEIDTSNDELSVKKQKIGDNEDSINLLLVGLNVEIEKESFPELVDKRESSNDDLDDTVTVEDLSNDDITGNPETDQYAKFTPQRQSTGLGTQEKIEIVATNEQQNLTSQRSDLLNDDYAAFVPQKQSTALDSFPSPLTSKLERKKAPPFVTASSIIEESLIKGENSRTCGNKKLEIIDDRCNFTKLEQAANSVANDIFNTSIELAEENEHYVSAESEVFEDPTNFDFLLSKTPRKNTKRDLRALSLYVKFDPLVSNTSMLPQGNIQSPSPPTKESRNGENNTTIANVGTPKRNPAIAAIDRLLFYSPMSGNTTPTNTDTTIQNTNDTQEKLKPTQETSEETINMAKELELVRTTVLQLEEQLEKLKIDHEEALEKQTSYKEKINQLQAQLAQEIKNKNEITVVVDEYEISISRLVAERERDRKNLDLEKAKLQEELAAAKHHLDNTEAAFNDVHLKYERLKSVVATYKSNEAALKESLQENVEIIKSLENRYEQVKSHATARLEKANQELDDIRKQHESETVRIHAMLRKSELKSNSLAELVEQKSKENKELTQILDEVIARVGCNKSD